MVGYLLTWQHGRGRNKIKERLDQMVASDEWSRIFPHASVHNLISGISDHSPLLLLLGTNQRTKRHVSFRFENAWLGEANLDETVIHNWAQGDVMSKLNACRDGLRIWGRVIRSNFLKDIKLLKTRLNGLRAHQSSDSLEGFLLVQKQLSDLLLKEEQYWKQR
ncbi:uncharacterized protein LOC105638521 [Jatropha curcas]|uniref:uncharacterized protein LOC105638521 n=1 Tax=Jatropha curcas TaxID=180498 RepID=UPI0005FB643B|nr:uncharacterized protein LOC105638521 [Jatropha curcas]